MRKSKKNRGKGEHVRKTKKIGGPLLGGKKETPANSTFPGKKNTGKRGVK